ncbi:MAG: flagellar motor protein MotB [Eubacteriales bacterium]|nr:flagellar motor protein MotB [Eubacteriales bacterium]
MKRRKKKSSINKNGWLATYADMVTLILVFFILLYSMSTIDREKYEMLVRAFTMDSNSIDQMLDEQKDNEQKDIEINKDIETDQKLSVTELSDLEDLYKYLSEYVKENNLQDSVQVAKGDNLVYVRFTSSLFFEPDKAILKVGGRDILTYVGRALNAVEPNIKYIRIDGHTAESAPGTSTVNDRDLSTQRANEVLKFLENRFIKEPAKLYAVGYGRYRPVAPNDSEINRAKNRRVEILVSDIDSMQETLDEIYYLVKEQKDNN